MVERAMAMWGGDSTYSAEVIDEIFKNAKRSK
jgi:hypothetical protein